MNHDASVESVAKTTRSSQPTGQREIGKFELLDGSIVAKPRADRWHNLIATNFTTALGSRIQRSGTEIYAGSIQVQMAKNTICFPDVVVVRGEPVFTSESADILQNPTVVVEIYSQFSHSTERTQKLEGFLSIPGIKDILLVNKSEMRIEHYSRQNAKQWIYRIYDERDDVIGLDSITCKLSLAEVYAQVKLRTEKLSSKAVH